MNIKSINTTTSMPNAHHKSLHKEICSLSTDVTRSPIGQLQQHQLIMLLEQKQGCDLPTRLCTAKGNSFLNLALLRVTGWDVNNSPPSFVLLAQQNRRLLLHFLSRQQLGQSPIHRQITSFVTYLGKRNVTITMQQLLY